ncbi:hypothetical protein [Streptacidiphilus jiangxiensis]|uniref:Uncharacterized protein n=1 Tax=Streptacidiphilus jiangxiensis TaxID=235985 RepID=A0A1H7I868_STRJI|nr:hypothetical protein [Streptacidiphilus jiangxiensis]SEK56765.1 hypothetical protein SAMN05414137_102475 [Streptacidiphilus jiangxiensis]
MVSSFVSSFVGLVVLPLVVAGLVRWAAARRRRGLAAGRAVHFRGRLDGRKGRLLVDPRLDTPVFLGQDGSATALPRGGKAVDATALPNRTGQPAFERVGLRYRTPEGATVRLSLGTHDARTVGTWLNEPTDAVPSPRPRRLPVAPLWAVLALAFSALVVLAAVDVALLGTHTTAEVVSVDGRGGICVVRWAGGSEQSTVDCDTAQARAGDHEAIIALPWPFLGKAVDTVTTSWVAVVSGGGSGLLGLAGAVVLTPLACARRVRRAQAAGPLSPTPQSATPDNDEDDWPSLADGLSYASLSAVARYADRHGPGAKFSAPRRRSDQASLGPRRWAAAAVLGTEAWFLLALSVGGMLDDHFHLGHWRFLLLGPVAVAALARIGWFTLDRAATCGPVLRAVREGGGQPMRYVRLRRETGVTALVLFPAEGGEAAAPQYVQLISACRGGERRTVGGPAPVGEALVHDSGTGLLLCEIDGVRYLPRGRVLEIDAEPVRGREELLRLAGTHRRPVDPS